MHHLAQGTRGTRRRVVGSVPQPQTTIGEDPFVVPVVETSPAADAFTEFTANSRSGAGASPLFRSSDTGPFGVDARHSRQGSNFGRVWFGIRSGRDPPSQQHPAQVLLTRPTFIATSIEGCRPWPAAKGRRGRTAGPPARARRTGMPPVPLGRGCHAGSEAALASPCHACTCT